MRARLAAAWLIWAACGGAGQPARGPSYDPVNTPEAPTACPDQRDQAHKAREAVLGARDPAIRSAAAAAVFAHAECERAAFDRVTFASTSQVGLLASIRQARDMYQTAVNLYGEVVGYSELEYLQAGARMGDAHAAFAEKLRAVQPPADVRDPVERAEYRAELSALAATLDREAALAYAKALEAATTLHGIGGFDARGADWVRASCVALARLAPRMGTAQPLCGR